MSANVSSREERRAEAWLERIERAQQGVGVKILEQLYEETRPRDETNCRRAGFIDDKEEYRQRIYPAEVGGLKELCERLDEQGVVNIRRIRDRGQREQMIERALRELLMSGKIESDLNGTQFWLAYDSYQLEACRDDERRQRRQNRYDQRRLRKVIEEPVGVAS
jgi:hypothetical protein